MSPQGVRQATECVTVERVRRMDCTREQRVGATGGLGVAERKLRLEGGWYNLWFRWWCWCKHHLLRMCRRPPRCWGWCRSCAFVAHGCVCCAMLLHVRTTYSAHHCHLIHKEFHCTHHCFHGWHCACTRLASVLTFTLSFLPAIQTFFLSCPSFRLSFFLARHSDSHF